MQIVVRLDVMLARRKMTSRDLAEKIGITEQNLSLLKSGKVKGVRFETLNESLMVTSMPGLFCAGEMLDWEAPTGGYLLTACLATGRVAGEGALAWINR